MSKLPLSGIRVVDLSRVFAMPYAAAYLGDLGAEVIKIECCQNQFVDTTRTLNGPYPDNDPGPRYWERGGTFQTLNRGKRSLTLDLRDAECLEILKRLVQVSDVVIENFTPRVMSRFGLDYAGLRAVKPDLIMVSNTGYGHSGPWRDFGAMASALEPTHGAGAFTGYLEPGPDGRLAPGDAPNKIGNSYTDFLASWSAQLAVLACLFHRAQTGRGMWIDLAMYQVGVSFLGEGLLDFAFNRRRARRLGNRHEFLSPHGCYPCRGEDEWVVLAARNDAEWQALRRALDPDSRTLDAQFDDPIIRYRRQDELDAVIAAWTSAREQRQVMEELQALGIPAGPVLNARQLLTDPHLRARGFFEAVEHPAATGLGRREYLGRGWKLSGNDVHIRRPAPLLGEANDYVLGEILGFDRDRVEALRQARVIGEELEDAGMPNVTPLDRQVDLGWFVAHDPDYRERLPNVNTGSS